MYINITANALKFYYLSNFTLFFNTAHIVVKFLILELKNWSNKIVSIQYIEKLRFSITTNKKQKIIIMLTEY